MTPTETPTDRQRTPEGSDSASATLLPTGLAVSFTAVLTCLGLVIALGLLLFLRAHSISAESAHRSSRIVAATMFRWERDQPQAPLQRTPPISEVRIVSGGGTVHSLLAPAPRPLWSRPQAGPAASPATGTAATAADSAPTPADTADTDTTATAASDAAALAQQERVNAELAARQAEAEGAQASQDAEDSADAVELQAARARQQAEVAFQMGRITQGDLNRMVLFETQEQARAESIRTEGARVEAQAQERARQLRAAVAGQ